MAEATNKEVLETPPDHSDETPNIGLEDLSEVLNSSNENIEQTTTVENNRDTKPVTEIRKEVKPDSTEKQETAKQEVSQQEIPQSTEKEVIESLKKQLELYQTIYGNPQAQPVQTNNETRTVETTRQQQKDILDDLEINNDDLIDLLSGDASRAKPVIKKFIRSAMQATMMQQAQVAEYNQRTHQYINGVQEIFYDRYKDLSDFRPIVKLAGDQIQMEYQSKGIVKYPHDLIDEIGSRARKIRDEFKNKFGGVDNPPPPKPVIRQGEVGSTRLSPPTPEKLTEEQQEMLDLIQN